MPHAATMIDPECQTAAEAAFASEIEEGIRAKVHADAARRLSTKEGLAELLYGYEPYPQMIGAMLPLFAKHGYLPEVRALMVAISAPYIADELSDVEVDAEIAAMEGFV